MASKARDQNFQTSNGVSEKMATLKSGSAFSKTVQKQPENGRKHAKTSEETPKRAKRLFFSIFFQLPPDDPEAPQPPRPPTFSLTPSTLTSALARHTSPQTHAQQHTRSLRHLQQTYPSPNANPDHNPLSNSNLRHLHDELLRRDDGRQVP